MYFEQFESWKSVVEQSGSVAVECITDLDTHISSAIPKPGLEEILAEIQSCLENKTPWWQWDRNKGEVVVVPYEQIRSLKLKLSGR